MNLLTRIARTLLIGLSLTGVYGCNGAATHTATIRPSYDNATGRLKELAYDANGNGSVDTWTEMDGSRPLRSRVDINEDGKIDRWEYYDAAQSGPDGRGALVRAEEDTTHDGRPDKWETYEHGILKTVAFDENGNGRPTRRLIYSSTARVVIESDPDASGRLAEHVDVR